jgi:hypothetical protein
MKRAKIMLMAIALVGIVGGALAFKASKISVTSFYCSTTAPGGPTLCLPGHYSTAVNGNPIPVTLYLTKVTTTGSCPASVTNVATTWCTTSINALVYTAAGE